MTDVAAGWYPDPTLPPGSAGLRFWDGQAWTEHVAAPQQQAWAPEPGPTTPDGVPLAGYGSRVAAYLLDTVMVGGVSMLFSIPQQREMNAEMERLQAELTRTGDMGAFWDGWLLSMRDSMTTQWPLTLAVLAYFLLMLRFTGATLGKLALGLRVRRREQPGQLPWSTVLLRVAVYNGVGLLPVLSLMTGSWVLIVLLWGGMCIYLLVDLLWPLWDDKRQALHDKVARTNVVKVR